MAKLPRRSVGVKSKQYDTITKLADEEGITRSSWLERVIYKKLAANGIDMGDAPKMTPKKKPKEEDPSIGSGYHQF